MIILDERQFLKKELEAKGFDLFDFYEDHKCLGMKEFSALDMKRRGEFLLVDTQTILNHPEIQETFKSLLNTFLGAIFFHEHSNEKAQEWVKNEGAFLTKIIGEYSLPMPQLNWTMLSNQLQFFWGLLEDQRSLQRQMTQFSLELDEVLKNAEVEMTKAKKIHEVLVPKRNEEIKGIVFNNKYASGEGGGGEFYDLVQGVNKVYQVFVSSQSYLISSSLLGILGQHRDNQFDPSQFLKDAQAEIDIINNEKKKKYAVSITILEIDMSTLRLKRYGSVMSEVYSLVKGKVLAGDEDFYQLVKGEKLIVLSSGFLFNWKEAHPGKDIMAYLKDNSHVPSNEMMSELFFQLKEGQESKFLKKDAIVAMMEVNRHGIHKV